MMLNVVKMMVIVCAMMVGWEHTAMKFVRKGMQNISMFRFQSENFLATATATATSIASTLTYLFSISHTFQIYRSIFRFYGKHCMEECSCPSPQFVCHAARGCVCKSGFDGIDCLSPKSLTGQSSKLKCFIFALCTLHSALRTPRG